MSGTSYANIDYVYKIIEGAKSHGEKWCEIFGGPCCDEIINELKEKGYKIEEHSEIKWKH
jgi:hypothetical protein